MGFQGGVTVSKSLFLTGMDRRGFLGESGRALLALSFLQLAPAAEARSPTPERAAPRTPPSQEYRDWLDVWTDRWTWDKVVHSSHARANCVSACSWNVFVKNGIAWREEQKRPNEGIRPYTGELDRGYGSDPVEIATRRCCARKSPSSPASLSRRSPA